MYRVGSIPGYMYRGCIRDVSWVRPTIRYILNTFTIHCPQHTLPMHSRYTPDTTPIRQRDTLSSIRSRYICDTYRWRRCFINVCMRNRFSCRQLPHQHCPRRPRLARDSCRHMEGGDDAAPEEGRSLRSKSSGRQHRPRRG